MNALDVANELDHVYELSNIFECKAGADTIRQQQALIERKEKDYQTSAHYAQLVLRTNEQLMLELVLLRKAQEK